MHDICVSLCKNLQYINDIKNVFICWKWQDTIEKHNCANLFLILLLFSLSSNMGFIPMLEVPSFQLEFS